MTLRGAGTGEHTTRIEVNGTEEATFEQIRDTEHRVANTAGINHNKYVISDGHTYDAVSDSFGDRSDVFVKFAEPTPVRTWGFADAYANKFASGDGGSMYIDVEFVGGDLDGITITADANYTDVFDSERTDWNETGTVNVIKWSTSYDGNAGAEIDLNLTFEDERTPSPYIDIGAIDKR
ncbi:hypothetical protein [Halosegnis longus]|uniref:hypothetical protein n=1 Tax=Halosegnis longus TaxID=2216012 RepID=UPI00129E283C|nr:hypothetical protein [Halosegnis longus]